MEIKREYHLLMICVYEFHCDLKGNKHLLLWGLRFIGMFFNLHFTATRIKISITLISQINYILNSV